VTDDFPLSEGVKGLRIAHREIFLNGQQYSTARLTTKFSLEVLRELYVKCGTGHEFWQSAVFSFKIHYNGHQGQPGQKHYQTVVAFFGQIPVDRREKEQLCMAEEFGEIFGAENA
jgi:hypothetical protein